MQGYSGITKTVQRNLLIFRAHKLAQPPGLGILYYCS